MLPTNKNWSFYQCTFYLPAKMGGHFREVNIGESTSTMESPGYPWPGLENTRGPGRRPRWLGMALVTIDVIGGWDYTMMRPTFVSWLFVVRSWIPVPCGIQWLLVIAVCTLDVVTTVPLHYKLLANKQLQPRSSKPILVYNPSNELTYHGIH